MEKINKLAKQRTVVPDPRNIVNQPQNWDCSLPLFFTVNLGVVSEKQVGTLHQDISHGKEYLGTKIDWIKLICKDVFIILLFLM